MNLLGGYSTMRKNVTPGGHTLILDPTKMTGRHRELALFLSKNGFGTIARNDTLKSIERPALMQRLPTSFVKIADVLNSRCYRTLRYHERWRSVPEIHHVGHEWLGIFYLRYAVACETEGHPLYQHATLAELLTVASSLQLVAPAVQAMRRLDSGNLDTELPYLAVKLYEAIVPFLGRNSGFRPYREILIDIAHGHASMRRLKKLVRDLNSERDKREVRLICVNAAAAYRPDHSRDSLAKKYDETGIDGLFL